MNIVFFSKGVRIQLSLRERDKTKYIKLNPGRLVIMKKVLATVLAAVSVLSSMAVVSAGAAYTPYDWTAKSDDGDGYYIRGKYCSEATNWKNVYTANNCYWDTLSLKKNDQTTVRYFDRKDKATRWKVRAGSWSDVGVYCDILADDNKYSVNHWSPAPGKLAVESGIVDYRGKTKRANAVNAINGAGAYSRIEADWF